MKTCYQAEIIQMGKQIEELFKPKPKIYWFDFITTGVLSWSLFLFAIRFPLNSVLFYLLICLSAVGFYRMLVFTHELAHLKKGSLPGFHFFWHVFCGLPFLAPHFLYKGTHLAHHSKKSFGTIEDGEYFQFGKNSFWLLVLHFLYNFIIPLISILRFMFVAIISICHPGLRNFVMKKMSFMGLTFFLTRKLPHQKLEKIIWYCEEISCTFFCWFIFTLILFDKIPSMVFFQWYGILVFILTLNSLRAITSHVYTSSGKAMTFQAQIQDSITITSNSIFTKIMCPVGTQYHALHHMFPSIPYHALGKAQKFLQTNFPNEAFLSTTTSDSLFNTWKMAWNLHIRNKHYTDESGNFNKKPNSMEDWQSEII